MRVDCSDDLPVMMKKKPKIILIPYPAQGHVTPMLNLASAFLTHAFQPIIVTPNFIHHRLLSNMSPDHHQVRFMSLPDGLDQGGPHDFFSIENAMENVMPMHLESLIRNVEEEEEENGRVVLIIIDLLASWAIEVANRCGIQAAGYWPVFEAVYQLITAIPDMVHSGLISETAGCPRHQGSVFSLPNQPMLSTEDLPWLIGSEPSREARFKFWTRTLQRSKAFRWVLVNSFPQQFPHNFPPENPIVCPVAPFTKTKPSVNKIPSFWKEDSSCLDWLDNQKPNSVLYISFGSWVSPIGDSKIRSLAITLEALNQPFLWVLPDSCSWRQGLPIGYLERICSSQLGKVVSWAPQLQVLQHKAVGLYLTHCGWNSTVEAIQCQKRLLCYPIAGDQFLNCQYIVKVWKIGVRVYGFGKKDVEEALKEVNEYGEMKERLMRVHQSAMGEEACSRASANLKAFLLDSSQVQPPIHIS